MEIKETTNTPKHTVSIWESGTEATIPVATTHQMLGWVGKHLF